MSGKTPRDAAASPIVLVPIAGEAGAGLCVDGICTIPNAAPQPPGDDAAAAPGGTAPTAPQG